VDGGEAVGYSEAWEKVLHDIGAGVLCGLVADAGSDDDSLVGKTYNVVDRFE